MGLGKKTVPTALDICNRAVQGRARAFSSRWKQQRDSDMYANKAIAEGLRSRAAYKLDEINKRAGRFLRQGAAVVDLGASPGGFSMIAGKLIRLDRADDCWNLLERKAPMQLPKPLNPTIGGSFPPHKYGKLICVDLQDMECIPGAMYAQGDINDDGTYQKILFGLAGREADVVLSDMAPNTTGEKERDHLLIMQLADEALALSQRILRNGGVFCCKVFMGAEENAFRKDLESSFVKVKAVKPAASKKASKEIYYVAHGYVPAHMDHRSRKGFDNLDEIYEEITKERAT